MSNRTTGTILIATAAGAFLYGIYLVAGAGWTAITGAFFLYVAGYHILNKRDTAGGDTGKRHAEATELIPTSITEARRQRGWIDN